MRGPTRGPQKELWGSFLLSTSTTVGREKTPTLSGSATSPKELSCLSRGTKPYPRGIHMITAPTMLAQCFELARINPYPGIRRYRIPHTLAAYYIRSATRMTVHSASALTPFTRAHAKRFEVFGSSGRLRLPLIRDATRSPRDGTVGVLPHCFRATYNLLCSRYLRRSMLCGNRQAESDGAVLPPLAWTAQN
jgi:hypothetical protein